jgi:hypothetical protein
MVEAQSNMVVVPGSKKSHLILLFAILATFQMSFGQTATFSTSGNWNNAANWSGSNIGDLIAETIAIGSNKNATLVSGDNYTVGNITVANNSSITVNSGATLTLGASGNAKSLTISNIGTLTISGTIEIWGDLNVSNSLILNVTGNVIIHGNVVLNNGGDLTVSGSGSITIGGSLTGGANTHLTTSGGGTMAIGGDLNLGGGTSSIDGPGGSISVGGSCSCTGCGGSCPATVLPVVLLYFDAFADANGRVQLKWATESEDNFDRFELLHAGSDLAFAAIQTIPGTGYNTNSLRTYSAIDADPVIGDNYYRLNAIDIDGSSELFKIKHVRVSGKKSVTVYPNPTDGITLRFKTNFEPEQGDRVTIYDGLGSALLSLPVMGTENEYQLEKSLKPGAYVLKYTSSKFEKVARVIVSQ